MSQGEQTQDARNAGAIGGMSIRCAVVRPSCPRGLAARMSVCLCVLAGLLTAAAPSQAAVVHPYISQLIGTPKEAFSEELCGVSVDPGTGEVLVSDAGALKPNEEEDPAIDIFKSTNTFVGQINKGAGPEWFFREACSTAVNDATHNIYVANVGEGSAEAEDEKEAVFVYNPSGGKFKFEKKLKLEGANTPAGTFEIPVNGDELEPGGPLHVAIARSSEDIYVSVGEQGLIDHFNEAGEYLSQIVLPAESFPQSITTDSSGNVYAVVIAFEGGNEKTLIDEFSPEGSLVKQVTGVSAGGFGHLTGIAVDSAGHIYVSDALNLVVDEFNQAGAFLGRITGAGSPAGAFAEPSGVATNTAGDVYVSDQTVGRQAGTRGTVDEFGPATAGVGPFLESVGASAVTSTSATVEANVDPSGAQTSYRFEYAPQGGGSFTSLGEVSAGAGEAPERVEGQLTNLQPATTYEYRIVVDVEGHGSETSAVKTFTTEPEGVLSGLPNNRAWELVSQPNKQGALIKGIGGFGTVQASVDGSRITYTATSPTEKNAEANAGPVPLLSVRGGEGWSTREIAPPQTAQATVGGIGTKGVEDKIFSADLTSAIVAPFRPEPLLSPEASEATPYLRNLDDTECNIAETSCYLPIATDKEGYADVASGLPFGGLSFGQGSLFGGVIALGASPDLRHVVMHSDEPLKSGLEGKELYEWSAEAPVAERIQLVSILPDNEPAGEASEPGLGLHLGGGKEDVRNAVSTNGSRIVWNTNRPRHLYLRDTSKGETVQLDAVESGFEPEELASNPQFQTASANGEVVFFTDTEQLTKGSTATSEKPDLYVCRVGTNSEGKLACSLKDLTDAEAIKNSGERAFVQGILPGASEDGSYIYFVADGVLTTQPNSHGEAASPGNCGNTPPLGATCNLYVEHYDSTDEAWEEPAFIARLSNDDAPDWGGRAVESNAGRLEGGNSIQLDRLTARVSEDGQYLAFMSDRSLTGFDNTDASAAAGGAADEEVFLYHVGEGVDCASCNRFGRRPHGAEGHEIANNGEGPLVAERQGNWHGRWLAANVPGWDQWALSGFYQSRYLLNNGELFFNSWDSLVPNDGNSTADVYEYEPNGVGGCSSASGCQAMLSSGESHEESAFLDASANGGDAFFLTAQQLVSADFDQSYDVYDAHDCSESPCSTGAVSPSPCNSSASCQGTPSTSGAGITNPATGTVSSSGSVVQPPTPTTVVQGKKVVKPTRAQLLAKALKACKRIKKHKPRAKCEKTARKKYGAKKKAKSKKASHASVVSRRDR
jgi:hypothetical protein